MFLRPLWSEDIVFWRTICLGGHYVLEGIIFLGGNYVFLLDILFLRILYFEDVMLCLHHVF